MKTKTKLSIGITFLFVLIICMGAASIYFIRILARDSGDIIKDNQLSIDYVQAMQNDIDSVQQTLFQKWPGSDNRINLSDNFLRKYVDDFRKNLHDEANNITEVGEQAAVDSLSSYFNHYYSVADLLNFNTIDKKDGVNGYYAGIKIELNKIYQVNRNAILRKNQLASHSASNAVFYISLIGTIFFLVAFVFILNFPGYIADPIRNLSNKIRSIADGDFNQRLEIDPRGDEFGLVANSFNYLARKLQEYKESNIAEITTQKTRIESIVNSLDEAIILMDENNNIISVNPVAAELLGVASENLIGHTASSISGKNDLFKKLASNSESQENENIPLRITYNNQENYFQKYIHTIYHFNEWKQQTSPAGYLIVLKNITEFKRLDIAKTNFMATLSHELKTPLSSINLSLKLIKDERIGKLSPEQTQLIENIRVESTRLLRYVNELLDLSQIETGNIKLNVAPNDARAIINQSLDAMKPVFDQKHIQVEAAIPDGLPMISADSEKTVWVMTNLLTNATKFSQEGASVYVSVVPKAGMVQFRVRDEGPGIDPQYHDKIFERFVQIYGTDNHGGTGLGLAIAKDFIVAQGGTIWVESALGEGSTFIFELPVA